MNIKQEYVYLVGSFAAVLLLMGLGILSYGLSQGTALPFMATPTPTLEAVFSADLSALKIEPPPSLSEVAAQIRPDYPELADMLENPELGSVYKDFYLAYQEGGQPTAIALAKQRGILNHNDQIEMTLVLDTDDSDSLIGQLEDEGVIVQGNFKNLINIAIPTRLIEAQLEQESPDLIVKRLSELKHVIRLELPKKARTQQRGMILGQGVQTTLASHWHSQGVIGDGVKVGVLDLGFAGYEQLLGTELPSSVTVQAFGDTEMFDTEVHGTACAEIVHEMAPGAELVLAYYDGGDVSFAQAIEWLVAQEVDIITNSTNSIGTTPLDGTGFSVEMVEYAYQNGVFWVNSAGNYAENHHRGRYTDDNGDNLHDFGDATENALPFQASTGFVTRITLSWDDWQNVDQDYDLLLLDSDGEILAKSEDSQADNLGELPLESIHYEFYIEDVYFVAIQNYEGLARGDATFDLFIEPALLHPDFIVPEYSLGGPADAPYAFTVGATHWADDILEPYSSRGPTNDGRVKPNLSAPSVVDSVSYSPYPFDGTSASSPHVAGAAALILQANPGFGPDQVTSFLQNGALDLGDNGNDTVFGAGRLNLGAVPEDAETNTEPLPTPVVELRPTSTPRAVGLSTPVFGEIEGVGLSDHESDDLLVTLMVIGLCFVCLSGGVLGSLVTVGIVMMFR